MIRRASGVVLALVVAAALSGCDDERFPIPDPSDTPTVLPDAHSTQPPEQIDPRCIKEYGAAAELVYEGDIRARPVSWPTPAEFAVLCLVETHSDDEQTGHYALTYYTSFAAVTRYYETGFPAGAHGYAATDEGEVLTGVLSPSSYYIESTGTGRFAIHWASDGEWRD